MVFFLDGYQFEAELTKLFNANGYNATQTKLSGDGGVDIILRKNGKEIIYVQCKYNLSGRKIGVKVCRELEGVIWTDGISKGIVIGISGYTQNAKDFAIESGNIELWGINEILELAQNKRNSEESFS